MFQDTVTDRMIFRVVCLVMLFGFLVLACGCLGFDFGKAKLADMKLGVWSIPIACKDILRIVTELKILAQK